MMEATGRNEFGGCFDFFEWNAPYYETPQEVIQAMQQIDYKGKRIKSIRIIGLAQNVGQTNRDILYSRITDAGIEVDDNWRETYPHISKIRVPWEAKICEPVQLVFEDDTTLEILPIGNGGARVSVNSIPCEIKDGLNHSNFDADLFFSELIGEEIRSMSIYVEKSTKQSVDEYSIKRENTYEELRATWRFYIALESSYFIELVQTSESWYRIKAGTIYEDSQVPYDRVRKSMIDVDQIDIVNGRDNGGTFWICPLRKNYDGELPFFNNFGMSIEDGDIEEFLFIHLMKYFDSKIQETDEWRLGENRAFDWYGGNLYSVDTMRQMIADLKEMVDILQTDSDSPLVKDLIDLFSWSMYTDKHRNRLSEHELFQFKKKRIPVAVDFYKRFIKRMGSMLQLPGVDTISFAGP